MNIAIFVSGSGTNCENLIKYFSDSESVHIALVVSNKPDAYALVRAESLGVPVAVTPKSDLNNPEVMLPLLKSTISVSSSWQAGCRSSQTSSSKPIHTRSSTSTLPYYPNTAAKACGAIMCMRR